MGPAGRRLALLAAGVATLAVVACTNGGGAQATSPPAQSGCASVSDLVVYPYTDDAEFTGYVLARAWHVWFSAFGPVRSGKAAIADYTAGRPTKVVIHRDPELKQTVELVGTECSTETPLHFCYQQDNCGLVGQSFTADQLARLGNDRVSIAPIAGGGDYTGYMLFPRTGSYLLSVRSGATTLGSVTLAVSR